MTIGEKNRVAGQPWGKKASAQLAIAEKDSNTKLTNKNKEALLSPKHQHNIYDSYSNSSKKE